MDKAQITLINNLIKKLLEEYSGVRAVVQYPNGKVRKFKRKTRRGL